jgi:hypothetical protein
MFCSFKCSLDGLRWVAGNTFIVVFEPLKNLLITLFRSQTLGNFTMPESVKGQVESD